MKLFNFILSSGYYQRMWSEGYIVPIYKAADPTDPNNYRCITITSCAGKLFNRILNSRLESYIHEHGILHYEQIGFKNGGKTADHIFQLKTLFCKYLQRNKQIYLRKAFDSVVYPALLYKLLSYSIGGNFYSMIASMYENSVLQIVQCLATSL